MIDRDVIVIFGVPGVGKTTIAKELVNYGYFYYEGDDDLFAEVKELNRNSQSLTEDLRKRQNNFIIHHIVELAKIHPKLVVAYDFMWDRYRVDLLKLCPEARWFLLTISDQMLSERVERSDHLLKPEFALEIAKRFEPPSFPVHVVLNDKSVSEAVQKILT